MWTFGRKSANTGFAPADAKSDGYRGVFLIMQTPFLESLEVDELSLRKEVDFLAQCGVHGMVWPVAASESTALSYKERLKYAEVIVKENAGRTPVVVGVTACNKFEAAEYAEHAEKIGADAIIALAQNDGMPTDPIMFGEYMDAITSVCHLPLMVQTAMPGHGSALSPEYLLELAQKHPTFRCVKEEQMGFGPLPWRISVYEKKGNGRLTVMAGAGARNLMNEMERGSGGTMPGAGFADIQVRIWDSFHLGKKDEARELFAKMLMMAVLEQSTGYVLQKEILRRRGIFETTLMRSTRRPLMDEGDLAELDAIFATLRPYFCVGEYSYGRAAGV
jgi:dihydrodipicolinate synthase/N-acetylneuraminate lyase